MSRSLSRWQALLLGLIVLSASGLAAAGLFAVGSRGWYGKDALHVRVGFPEIRLNIFPGLGGTQRMPRRSGLVNASDPVSGDAGFTAVLTGKNFKAKEAAAIHMMDAVIPAGTDVDVK